MSAETPAPARSGPRIELRGATLTLGGVPALRDFSAVVEPGTLSALIGGDGAGKTTLLSALARPRGRALLGVDGLSAREIGFQPASSGVWPNLSVEENLGFVADAQGLHGPARRTRIDALIELAGLDSARRRIGAKLSGGMRQKLGAIMAMLHRPGLLLLDEPTSGVDPESREVLARLIRTAADEGATVIVATTYLDEAESADQVILLDSGRILAQGTPAEVIARAPGSLWRAPAGAIDLARTGDEVWQRGGTLFEWRAHAAGLPVGGGADPATASEPGRGAGTRPAPGDAPRPLTPLVLRGALPAEEDLELATIEFLLDSASTRGAGAPMSAGGGPTSATSGARSGLRAPARSAPDSPPAIECARIRKTFGDVTALDGVGIVVRPGEVVGLIGGNGAGKSTLIRLILGIDTPDSGEVRLFGERPSPRTRARLGYVSQSLSLSAMLSPDENLAFTQEVFGVPKAQRIVSPLPRVPVGRLPLGARRTLAVDAALSHAPELLILDEPSSGMDSLSRARLWKRIRSAALDGVGVLVTTHYQQEAAQCDLLVRLDAGRVVETRGR